VFAKVPNSTPTNYYISDHYSLSVEHIKSWNFQNLAGIPTYIYKISLIKSTRGISLPSLPIHCRVMCYAPLTTWRWLLLSQLWNCFTRSPLKSECANVGHCYNKLKVQASFLPFFRVGGIINKLNVRVQFWAILSNSAITLIQQSSYINLNFSIDPFLAYFTCLSLMIATFKCPHI